MTTKDHHDLIAWQLAMKLVERIYRLSSSWPDVEKFGLISQIRRAAVSIPSNIAEGQGRRSNRDFARFLCIAHGSLMEVDTQLHIAEKLSFLTLDELKSILVDTKELGRVMFGLIVSVRKTA